MTSNRKSTIDQLDPEIRSRVDALLKEGRHTLDGILTQIKGAFPEAELPSRSALGRYSKNFEVVARKMRESREVAKVWAERLGNEPQGDIGKLVMELLRTMAFDVTLSMTEEGAEVDPGDLNKLALAMQRLEAAGKWNLQREQATRAAALEEAAKRVSDLEQSAGKNGFDVETLKRVREEIYGLTG